MNKKILALAAVMLCIALSPLSSAAQNNDSNEGIWYSRNVSIGYVTDQTLKSPKDEIGTDWGVTLQSTRSTYLHKRPIAGMLKLAIDFGCEGEFFMYEKKPFNLGFKEPLVNKLLGTDKLKNMYQFDARIGLGPSVKFAPLAHLSGSMRKLNATAYWHYNVGLSVMRIESEKAILDDAAIFAFCYGPSMGLRLSFGKLSVGYQLSKNYGKYMCKYEYTEYVNGAVVDEYNGDEKIKLSGTSSTISIGINF